MSKGFRRIIKITLLALGLSVCQLYVQAMFTGASGKNAGKEANHGDSEAKPRGRLMTLGNDVIEINGNKVKTGATVFSGARLQTQKTGATVQLDLIGKVELARQSLAMLNFNKGEISLDILSGCAILTTLPGVKGVISTPQKAVHHTDAANGSVIDICVGEPTSGAPIVGDGAARKAGAGAIPVPVPAAGGLWPLFPFGSGVAGSVIGTTEGDQGQNPSPMRPGNH